jgi:DNA-binding transcriptional LysR family regulator
MNIHHLELFYYVAKHEGIMPAVRHIPYGIQQPAVSSQIAQLENALGVPLFQRRPFLLTTAGKELYAFIQPFFSSLDAVEERIRGKSLPHFRFGASGTVLRVYLPDIAKQMAKVVPQMRLSLREGHQPQLLDWLTRREIDMALTTLDGKPPAGTRAVSLIKLPLALLVTKSSRYTSAKQLWDCDRIQEPLISLPAHEGVARRFQQGLRQVGVDWFPSIEVTTLDLTETYVNNGHGFGIAIADPRHQPLPNVRVLPLDGFPLVELGVIWQGKLTPLMKVFLDTTQQRARDLQLQVQRYRHATRFGGSHAQPNTARQLKSIQKSTRLVIKND